MFRIARRVAKDRVISTVDPQSAARAQDGGAWFRRLQGAHRDRPGLRDHHRHRGQRGQRRRRRTRRRPARRRPARRRHPGRPATAISTSPAIFGNPPNPAVGGDTGDGDGGGRGDGAHGGADQDASGGQDRPAVYGDAAYGAGALLATLEAADARIFTKVQPPTAPGGRFAKDRFGVDLAAGTVTCPNAVTVPIRPAKGGGGNAVFGPGLRRVPAGDPVHQLDRRSHHHHRPLRGRTRPRPRRSARPGLGHRVQGHPPEGGTQDRPPDAPPPRRPTRSRPRPHQGRRRLLSARRRGQPCPTRRARTAPRRRKLGCGSGLKPGPPDQIDLASATCPTRGQQAPQSPTATTGFTRNTDRSRSRACQPTVQPVD